MAGLFEFKEKLKYFYTGHEKYLKPILKFIAIFVAMILLKQNLGYMDAINSWPVIVIISVLFALLPWSMIIVGLSIILVINVYALSTELAVLVAACLLIMYLFFFRFTPKEGVVLVVMPLAFCLKVPYVAPIAAGLVSTPVSIVSVAFGTIVYYMLSIISKNAAALVNMSGDDGAASGVNSIVDMIGSDSEMLLTIVAFIITLLLVYFIRRASIDNAWIIAIVTGGIVDFVIILVGSLLLDTEISILWLILGTVLSILLAIVLQFFVFSVDYARAENTQFEDDEYYYYVKAVPKINVVAPEMNVKRINAQRTKKKPKTPKE